MKNFDDEEDRSGYYAKSDLNEQIVQCFLRGFVANTALALPGKTFKTIATGQTINIHPSSSVFGRKVDAVMYTEYVSSPFSGRFFQTAWLIVLYRFLQQRHMLEM